MAVPTRADVESVLVARAADAMRMLGLSLARDAFTVADADLARLAEADVPALLDAAEYRLLDTLATRAASLVDQQIGLQNRLALSQAARALADARDKKLAYMQRTYGLG